MNIKVLNSRYIDIISIIFCFLFISAGILVSLNRYWQYEVFYYDFGIFDQAIWNVSRFNAPIIDHIVVGGKWIFADHFNPSIFFLSPLYWFTNKSEILLVAQSIIVGLSGLVLYKIGFKIIKDRFLSLAILTTYFLFVGLQNALIFDFHEVTISTLSLILTFWAIVNKKKFWYFVFLIITLGFKESIFILGVGIGVSILFIRKDWIKIGFITILLSLIWGYAAIKIIIPYFSGGFYQYSTLSPLETVLNINRFFDIPIKIKTFFFSFLSFGFLPLLSPAFWFLIFQDFLIRFIPQTPTRWDLGLHYSAQLASLMALSSIFGIVFLKRFKIFLKYAYFIGVVLILNSFVFYQFVLHGPLILSYNSIFYKHTADFKFLDELIKRIPQESSVMTQNNLAVRFTHQKVWLLRADYYSYKPDYVLLDLRKGQNPNDFFGSDNHLEVLEELKKDSHYSIIYKSNEQFIFKRNK